MNRLFLCYAGTDFLCGCVVGITTKENGKQLKGIERYDCKCLLHGTYHLLYIPVLYSTKWIDDDIQEFVKKIFE